MRKLFVILSFFCLTSLFGQKIDSTEIKEIEMSEQMMFIMNSEVFKKQDYYSKLDKEYIFPWKDKKYTSEQLKNALDTIVKNSKIQINDEFSNLVLQFDSHFPTYINDEVHDIFKLTIESNQIKNLNDKIAEIEKEGSTSYGSISSSVYKNGQSYYYNWTTINKTFDILSDEIKQELKGEAFFKASFILDYNYVKINKSDIGESFNIGNHEFKVIDFFENKVILHFKDNTENLKFSFANIDNEGNKISQLSLFSFLELKEKNKKIPSNASPLPEGSQTMYKTNYDLFKSKPNLSFDEYKNNVHHKFLEIQNSKNQKGIEEKVWGTEYIVFIATDKMQNFYLYLPNTIIEKEFKLPLE